MANREQVDKIVRAYAKRNSLPADQLPALIASINTALAGTEAVRPSEPAEKLVPAVPIRRSIQPKSLTCLECGYTGKMLRRHLQIAHGLTTNAYRERWRLKDDYPMVAPNYATRRSELAKTIGLRGSVGGQKLELPMAVLDDVAPTIPSASRAPIDDRAVSEELSLAPPPHSEPLNAITRVGDQMDEPPVAAPDDVTLTEPSTSIASLGGKPVSEELSLASLHPDSLDPVPLIDDQTGEPPVAAPDDVALTEPSISLAPVGDKSVSEELSPASYDPEVLEDERSHLVERVAAQLSPTEPTPSLNPTSLMDDQTGEPPVAALDDVALTEPSTSFAPAGDKSVREELSLAPPLDQKIIDPVIFDAAPCAAGGETFPHALHGPDDLTRTNFYKGRGELPSADLATRPLGRWLDDVFRRVESERGRGRRMRWSRVTLASIAALAIAVTGLAFYVSHRLKNDEKFLNATLETTGRIVTDTVEYAERHNLPRGVTVALLNGGEALINEMARYGRPTPELRFHEARMLIQFARNYALVGDTARATAHTLKAREMLTGLTAEKVDDAEYEGSLSATDDELGATLVAQGNLTEALQSYRDSLMIRDRLAKSDPDNAGLQHDLSVSYDKIGGTLITQGNLTEALSSYRDGVAIRESLAKSDPNNGRYQRELSVAYNEVGDVLVAQSSLNEALRWYRDALVVRQRLAKANPDNANDQRELSISYNEVGDMLVAQGNLTEALQSYRDGLAIRDGLAKPEPGNTSRQRDLSISFSKVGDMLVTQGNLNEALQSYRDGLAIIERLNRSDPGNTGWQHDLSVSHNKVGDVLVAQGNLAEALQSYRDGLAIDESLAKSDPGNAGWQRDLSVSYERVGDVLVAQGNLAEALQSYRDSQAIRERLAKSDAGNAGWQRDLSVSYERVGDVLVTQGNLAGALQSYRNSLAIRDRLAKSDPGNAARRRDLSVSYNKVGDVQVAQANLPEALQSYRDGLAIAENLAKSDPDNTGWQRDLSVSYERVGDVLVTQGNLAEALQSYRGSQAIRERLAKSDPGNAGWQRDLSVSHARLADLLLKTGQKEEAHEHLVAGRTIITELITQHSEATQLNRDLSWFNERLAALK